MSWAAGAGDVAFLVCVPLVSSTAGLALLQTFTGLALPPGYLETLERADDPVAAGIDAAIAFAHDVLRIDGVQQVRESKYIMLHAPRSALPAIRKLLPGSESPTIIPLEGHPDRVAVHAVCRENVFWETLESLKAAGASALLVLPVEKMLA